MPIWNEFDLDFPSIGIFVNRPKWMRKKNCFDEPVDTFYPAPGDVERLRRAKSICKECEVRQDCLQFALDTNERFGIWGGKSARERSLILRAQRLLARPHDRD
jgi:WhiB family redox-sensing transcriptional regulator